MEEVKVGGVPEKKLNPKDRSNFISRLFFCYLLPYFVKGYKRELTEDDMYRHRSEHDSSKLGQRLEERWIKHVAKNKNPAFWKVLMGTFFWEIFGQDILVILCEAVRMAQPFIISKLLIVYEKDPKENINEVYLYSGLIVATSFISVVLVHRFCLGLFQIGMKMRIASCSLIYRKALRLSKSALAETTIGQMVNLLSNDVGRFDTAPIHLHHLYIAPIQALIVMVFLYIVVGWTGLLGTFFLLLSIPLQSWLGKKTSQFRLKTATRTDERVRLMNEIISGIQVIKMYTWEYPFAKLVEYVRGNEIKFIRKTSVIRGILISIAMTLNDIAVAICLVTYVLTGNPLTASYAFTVTSYYRLMGSLTYFLPMAVSQGSEMWISMKRIEKFLQYDELNIENLKNSLNGKQNGKQDLQVLTGSDKGSIHIKKASAKWLKSQYENNLENIDMDVAAGSVAAVVGSVGSGKTTLLHIIMKELELESGSVNVTGKISYASQEPWLFGGSIRQNILFGETYDQLKYNEVVRVCALERDFTLFPYGDRTLAGERGVTLSGGQRARINLARAVYKDADIYLLDDPLSAVDTHVGKHIFEECICEYLGSKCVVLVTHQLQYLKSIQNIYLLKNGQIAVSGSYNNIKDSNTHYSELLHDIEEEEEEIRRKSKVVQTKEEEAEGEAGPVLQREGKSTGIISGRVYRKYAQAGGHIFKAFSILFLFILSQALLSVCQYFVTFWVNIQQWKSSQNILNSTDTGVVVENVTAPLNLTTPPQSTDNTGFADWWLTPVFVSENTSFYFIGLNMVMVIIMNIRSSSFYAWAITASTKMHNMMFENIVYSPMRFFNINPSGRILNRFSKDIGALDEVLPMTIMDTLGIGLEVVAICFVLGSLTYWIMIPTILIGILFYVMKVVFLETSRDVKRVESVNRSPIYTHLTATLQGLTTIRAFKAEGILKNEFDSYQNNHSAAFFMYLASTRTFGFWLDFICVIYTALVLLSLIFIESETFGGNMGLALTQTLALTGMFQWGMRQWSELENQMTSVERVQEYADLKHEDDNYTVEIDETWPEKGKIEFKNLSLQYSPNDPPVLKNLSFVIKPSEKVGIVGRTGAGKSSLIQAVFRLTHIDGSILIDDIDTKSVALKKLRSKISIIPQEPVLFSGTLRNNLDPFDEYSDEILWNALEQVELKSAVDDLPAGLDSKMAEGGSNFSVGQRQLVCLARAVIRSNKILVLDEATANVDPYTDSLIQKAIRKNFDKCTVLTIAHRINTIMDSDKVLVMDAGRVVEFDHPHTLLQNQNGVFYSLVMQTGKATARTLMAIAEENKTIKDKTE
ncbi:probable multidrug resistance-associated protein lethal(2)03659 isoform X1 [Diabrotica virgifera virgifera]|uniref:Multidrug resistance-associated protein lethal(2)03659 n=2 Tax=Diabrotica virgifera virgifera TaxID=50390 RepID=A0ABM5L7A4_DIAVI|nr:probable multidrug resistance-associated protein lethal(2)03659 isoform X1 [Diabrotica virgifera virgifera]XP_050518319.1 probable multidrug resistance-associated protein lethal(2)03659 isoform X1 [Diabrotica virgifera virgifera]XP_050518320.1 probable multidrug resistance-associated protein lethal(2)03659 isoform X1 [Diabrotica virgifera virgifera]